jgi:hypothetical protein
MFGRLNNQPIKVMGYMAFSFSRRLYYNKAPYLIISNLLPLLVISRMQLNFKENKNEKEAKQVV